MLDEAKNAAEFNDYLRNVVYKFYTQTNLPVPKPEFPNHGSPNHGADVTYYLSLRTFTLRSLPEKKEFWPIL